MSTFDPKHLTPAQVAALVKMRARGIRITEALKQYDDAKTAADHLRRLLIGRVESGAQKILANNIEEVQKAVEKRFKFFRSISNQPMSWGDFEQTLGTNITQAIKRL